MSKKQSPVSNKPVAETYQHIYRGKVQEVAVSVHINYAEGHITLCDHNPANPTATQGKQWKFAKREIDFMQGWHDILDAMKSAITEATARLKAYQDAEEKAKVELAAKMDAEYKAHNRN